MDRRFDHLADEEGACVGDGSDVIDLDVAQRGSRHARVLGFVGILYDRDPAPHLDRLQADGAVVK